jgi:formylglycine-generating enzyme required for sulfatase activity
MYKAQGKASWADEEGRDRFGLWAEFVIEGEDGPVRQRMRWIQPGRFLMGSSEDEPRRFDDEGPQHWVNISNGFWIFNTPVTQALWQAVMKENPSIFKTPDRPVEQVSWDDCQKFLEKINDQLPGLNLSLPSESRWEYACRAGSTTTLDTIAWYGGNSGKDFELDNGYATELDNGYATELYNGYYTTDWKKNQHEDNRAGTHPVGQKQANVWGLYDMLGNVWEWTADPYQDAPVDGEVWEDPDKLSRVVRGGSWYNGAQYCRSTYRDGLEPGIRSDLLGFRCVRVQE